MNGSRMLIVIFLFQALHLFGENAKIKPDTVVLCYFGSGDGQIGVEISDMQYGPFSFDIDEQGNVYVSNHYNNRVIKFNAEGKVLKYFYPPKAGWISVYKDRIYVGNGSTWVYDTLGNLIKILKGIGYPRIDRFGNLCAYFSKGIIIFDKNFDTVAVVYKPFQTMAQPLWSGDRFISLSNAKEIKIKKFELSGKGDILEQIKNEKIARCNPNSEKFEAGWLEGEDINGNIYIQGHERYRDDVVIFVKLSPEGEFLGQLEVSYKDWEIRGDLGHAVRVSPRGDLYLANMDEEKYWIVRYPTEMFKKP